MPALNLYEDRAAIAEGISRGEHRNLIGGLWEEMGVLQTRFLKSRGLQPHHKFIDVGCGSLRAGVKLVEYLQVGHYYGIDISEDLIQAGYDYEIKSTALATKLPFENLYANAIFDISVFQTRFEYGIAQSVFSHLPLSFLSLCLGQLTGHFNENGRFYATFFVTSEVDRLLPQGVTHGVGNVISYADKDPFHFTITQIQQAVPPGWAMEWIGEWGHPRDQKIVEFIRCCNDQTDMCQE